MDLLDPKKVLINWHFCTVGTVRLSIVAKFTLNFPLIIAIFYGGILLECSNGTLEKSSLDPDDVES